ncbi:MAG: FISUMP domain-containing protein [Prolixibacteraceae bacterium]|nr:FISUMP domain-containing protein [Prolixibacteraceae bacterium]
MNKSYNISIKYVQLCLVIVMVCFFIRCQNGEDEPDPGEPVEITFEVTDPTETGASDGSVVAEITGGIAPFSFLWSNGAKSQNVEELQAGMYSLTVTDSHGQIAIDSVELTDVVKDADGNVYTIKKIGGQTWMKENLRVQHAPDSTAITTYVYNNDTTLQNLYGRLYTWHVAMNGSVEEGAQGICPCGWHIPSDKEFKELEIYLGMTESEANMVNVWRGSPVGQRLKAGGDSGYNAQMAGRYYASRFTLLGQWEYMWTSSENSSNSAWRRCLDKGRSTVGRYNTFTKDYGFSVRCIKDD